MARRLDRRDVLPSCGLQGVRGGRAILRARYVLLAAALTAGLTALAACHSVRTGATGAHRTDVLTAEEIAVSPARDALEAVRQLRPTWLRTHGSQSFGDPDPPVPLVYLGNQQYGTADSLRDFRAEDIRELRYLSPTAATTRYGTGHRGGVIEVFLRG
jgi:hypothetical protein